MDTRRIPGAWARALLLVTLALPLSACGGKQLNAAMTWDKQERTWLTKLPKEGAKGRPLVLVLHGGRGKAKGMRWVTRGRWDALADERGFTVVYPQGLGKSWNDGRTDGLGYATRHKVDDVGFLRALIQRLVRERGVDARRVFVAGISNGGFMAQRMACEAAGTGPGSVAGVVSVTAQLSVSLHGTCRPAAPVAVALVNGSADPLVPYGGGDVQVFGKKRGAIVSTDKTLAFWHKHNRCAILPQATRHGSEDEDDTTYAQERRWSDCGGLPVVGVKVVGGGHTWPQGRQYLPEALVGKVTTAPVGVDWMWAFFDAVGRRRTKAKVRDPAPR